MTRHQHILAWLNDIASDLRAIRQDIHAHPELGFEEQRTSALVARCLQEWGYEVHTGVGRTGVVGVLRNGTGTRTLGLRADMDALPIIENTGAAYSSRHQGCMHACGPVACVQQTGCSAIGCAVGLQRLRVGAGCARVIGAWGRRCGRGSLGRGGHGGRSRAEVKDYSIVRE